MPRHCGAGVTLTAPQSTRDSVWSVSEAELMRYADEHAGAYSRARPFPHCIMDGLFREDELRAAMAEFPPLEDSTWRTFTGPHEAGKQGGSDPSAWGPTVSRLMEALSSPVWSRFLERLTGVASLHGDITGGGMHQSGPGAHLDVHVDFSRHPVLNLDRRVNTLLYLNPEWTLDDGGSLELWSSTGCEQRIIPVLNRCVVFDATDVSFHGHPTPVSDGVDPATGEMRRRRSLAVYHYTEPEDAPRPEHTTLWLAEQTT